MALILHRAWIYRSGGPWSEDDYDVYWYGENVGRIFHVGAGAPAETPWMWSLSFSRRLGRGPHQGHTASREEAMRAFKDAWRRSGYPDH